MKKAQIKVGGLYTAKVNGKHTTVRVDDIRDRGGISGTHYSVTNLATGRTTVFHSAAKFRAEVRNETNVNQWDVADTNHEMVGKVNVSGVVDNTVEEGEYSSDPQEYHHAATIPTVLTAVEQESTPQRNIGFATKLAAMRTPRLTTIPDVVAGYTPTDEQRAILEAVLNILRDGNGSKVLVVNAGAGSGKTSTLRMLEEVLHGQIQYTAYNRPLVDESRGKFRRAKCSTGHGLAYGPVGSNYKHRLDGQRVRSKDVANMLGIDPFTVEIDDDSIQRGTDVWREKATNAGYSDDNPPPADWVPKSLKLLEPWQLAGYVSQALKKFSQTADLEIAAKHFAYIDGIDQVDRETGKRGRANNSKVVEYLLPFAHKFWADVCDPAGRLPFIHDYYVKMWQLSKCAIIPADHILLDEHQDTAPVFADVIRRQSATVVLVGDENQRIYEWRGAMNAADLFPDAPVLYLSQSFRFGQSVADVANSVLGHMQERTKLVMKGLRSIPSRVLLDLPTDEAGNVVADDRADEYVGKVCYLYRTNAGAISRILMEYAGGRRGCLVGKIDEVLKFVRGAQDLQSNPPRKTSCPDLAAFENWKEVQDYVEEDPDGGDLKLMVDLVDKFGCQDILSVLNNMPSEDRADFVCSTSHKSKGREWDTVVLGADFPPAHKMSDADCRLLYVAATRAKLVLDLTACTPFHKYRDKDGNEYPALDVVFSVEMPTVQELATYNAAKQAEKSAPRIAAPKMAPTATQSANGVIPAPAIQSPPEANVAQANGNGQSRPPATGFGWTNFSGKWCVRGPADTKVPSQVEVVRKNGTKSMETIKVVVKQFPDAWIYGV